MVARTVLPASSSMENIPALNFSTTFPITSIASSFGKLFPFPSRQENIRLRHLLACRTRGVCVLSRKRVGGRNYQRFWRCPPPPLRCPPPPDPRSVLGRASLTFRVLPSRSLPLRPLSTV